VAKRPPAGHTEHVRDQNQRAGWGGCVWRSKRRKRRRKVGARWRRRIFWCSNAVGGLSVVKSKNREALSRAAPTNRLPNGFSNRFYFFFIARALLLRVPKESVAIAPFSAGAHGIKQAPGDKITTTTTTTIAACKSPQESDFGRSQPKCLRSCVQHSALVVRGRCHPAAKAPATATTVVVVVDGIFLQLVRSGREATLRRLWFFR